MSTPLYTLRDVRQVYGTRTVLDIPALTVQRGEVLAVVGPSGAGKSTLLRLMALLETPTQGEMLLHLDGERVSAATASIAQRRLLAMVFQRPALLSRNVRANVAYGLRLRGERNGQKRVDAALERVSLTHLAHAHPRTLSGGEMQ
ncbi:MAG: ABC transporter ATP-binding protein, partial [Anaerolineae bacterium]|nr:ABC transporter ATP-binding protein [Anaerolineae bacterium]